MNIKAGFINCLDGFVLVYIQCRTTHPINTVGSLKDVSVCLILYNALKFLIFFVAFSALLLKGTVERGQENTGIYRAL